MEIWKGQISDLLTAVATAAGRFREERASGNKIKEGRKAGSLKQRVWDYLSG